MPTKNDLEQEIVALKRKLEEREEELDWSKKKMTKLDFLLQKVKEKIECPVCLDIPRKTPVPVCPNGHFVCVKCKTSLCPSCRVNMGKGKSLLASTIVENIDHKCGFNDCDKNFSQIDLAAHEALCPHRLVICPRTSCTTAVSLAKLADHLLCSQTCMCSVRAQTTAALITERSWNRREFEYSSTVDGSATKHSSWRGHIYCFSGKMFTVYPATYNRQFYFVILMLDSEVECSKFKFEMVVHENESSVFDSENGVRFQGFPLSVDGKKEERNIYVASEQLMARIFKDSEPKLFEQLMARIFKDSEPKLFSLSFKLTKRENV